MNFFAPEVEKSEHNRPTFIFAIVRIWTVEDKVLQCVLFSNKMLEIPRIRCFYIGAASIFQLDSSEK